MVDFGSLAEFYDAIKNLKKVGDMVGELGRNAFHNNNGKSNKQSRAAHYSAKAPRNGQKKSITDADFIDDYSDGNTDSQSAAMVPGCYQNVMEYMAELRTLQSKVD